MFNTYMIQPMLMVVFYIVIFILQINLIMDGATSKEKHYFISFYKSEIFVILSIICYPILFSIIDQHANMETAKVMIITIMCLIISMIMTGTAIIVHINLDKTLDGELKKHRYLNIVIPIVYILLLTVAFNPNVKYNEESKENVNYVVDYLNQKYGEHNFEPIAVKDYRTCQGECEKGINHYVIMSNKTRFTITLNTYSNIIVKDYYLTNYIYQNESCLEKENLNACFVDYIRDINKDNHLKKDLYEAYVYSNLDAKKVKEKYGEIPSMDVLIDSSDIDFLCFNLLEGMGKTNEETISLMQAIYKDYLKYYKIYDTYNDGNIYLIYKDNDPQESYLEIKEDKLILHYNYNKQLEIPIN